jgi:AcrR family transcriptional regulator
MNKRIEPLRALNMQKRRARILAEMRGLLTRGGIEAINLRDLARLAEVTVPTIYNLIGNKEEVMIALFSDVLTEIEARVTSGSSADPLAMAEAVVLESISLFNEDENFYRSAFLAVEYLDQSGQHHDKVAQVYAWGERLTTAGFIACRKARLLRGRIEPARLGELILRSYRTSCRAWAFGQLSLNEFRKRALGDVYITLAADAVDTFHALLQKKITTLAAVNPVIQPQRARTKEHAR